MLPKGDSKNIILGYTTNYSRLLPVDNAAMNVCGMVKEFCCVFSSDRLLAIATADQCVFDKTRDTVTSQLCRRSIHKQAVKLLKRHFYPEQIIIDVNECR